MAIAMTYVQRLNFTALAPFLQADEVESMQRTRQD